MAGDLHPVLPRHKGAPNYLDQPQVNPLTRDIGRLVHHLGGRECPNSHRVLGVGNAPCSFDTTLAFVLLRICTEGTRRFRFYRPAWPYTTLQNGKAGYGICIRDLLLGRKVLCYSAKPALVQTLLPKPCPVLAGFSLGACMYGSPGFALVVSRPGA